MFNNKYTSFSTENICNSYVYQSTYKNVLDLHVANLKRYKYSYVPNYVQK